MKIESRTIIKIFNNSKNETPKYIHEGDSGMDLRADLKKYINIFPNQACLIPTNIHVAVPDGYEIQIRSRSGLAVKNNVFVLNSPGTIDSNYRNSIGVILYNAGSRFFTVNHGDRIAQAVLCEVPKIAWEEVDSIEKLGDSDRNMNGFGSTGIK